MAVIVKKAIILILLAIGISNAYCQNSDSVVILNNNSGAISDQSPQRTRILTLAGNYIYPLTHKSHTNKLLERYGDACFIYPLLILNNVIIRDQEEVECLRSKLGLIPIERTKTITKEKAEKLGIPDVPKDGVVFVTTKKGVYIDLSCE